MSVLAGDYKALRTLDNSNNLWVNLIVGTGRYKENEFVKKWTAATVQSSNKATATTYFRTISKTFGMGSNDLSGYVHFLKTCPEIERHLHLAATAVSATKF